jgi:hypothetical protein
LFHLISLKKPEIVKKMVEYVINVVPGDEMEYFKMPFLSCEVFCVLCKPINEVLLSNDMRTLLFTFFENKNVDGRNIMPISSHVAASVARVIMIHIVKDLKGVYMCINFNVLFS